MPASDLPSKERSQAELATNESVDSHDESAMFVHVNIQVHKETGQ